MVTFGSEVSELFTPRKWISHRFWLDSPDAIARFLRAKWDLELNGSALIANPIPSEQEFPLRKWNSTFAALDAAERRGIRGKSTTLPAQYIADATGGDSLASNIALVKNNAA